MRLFIAINLPSNIKDYMQLLQQKLAEQNSQCKIKWVEPENLHLTLFFLGEVDKAKAEALRQQLAQAIKFTPFVLKLSKLGAFPNNNHARVIKISLIDHQELKKIYKNIRQDLEQFHLQLDNRPFSAHITLGRIKSFTAEIKLDFEVQPLEFNVDTIDLMESQLSSKGPFYNLLKKFE